MRRVAATGSLSLDTAGISEAMGYSDSITEMFAIKVTAQDGLLKSILEQATKTNGRVSSLEAFRAVLMVLGGIGMLIIGAVAGAVALRYLG